LSQAYFISAARNGRLYRELRSLLGCLRSAGIQVIVLKGAFLAEAVYGDIALRPMCDIDLMVPKDDLSKAQTILIANGGVLQQRGDIELFRVERHHHVAPVVVGNLFVELHWTITPFTGPVEIDAVGLWARARPATVAGVQLTALSPEDLLLHLCLHFGRDNRLTGLRSFCDIAQTISHYRREMDWQQVVRLAHEWGATRHVGLELHLARRMLNAAVPDYVLEGLVPGGIDRPILQAAMQFVYTQTDYHQWMSLFDMEGARSIGDKVKLLWRRVFLSRDEMAAVYPAARNSGFLWSYYLLRVRDVVRAYWFRTARRGLPLVRGPEKDRNVSLVNWLKSGKP